MNLSQMTHTPPALAYILKSVTASWKIWCCFLHGYGKIGHLKNSFAQSHNEQVDPIGS